MPGTRGTRPNKDPGILSSKHFKFQWKEFINTSYTPSLVIQSCHLNFKSIEITSVGSELKLSLAQLGFGSSFWENKLGSALLAMPSKKLGSTWLDISYKKKLSSARLALSFKKPSYLEKQKIS